MKSSNLTKFFISQLIIFFLFIILGFIYINNSYKEYKQEVLKNNAYIINNLIEQYPYLEEEIISFILEGKNDNNLELLKKYGLDEIEHLDYLENFSNLKSNLIIRTLILIILLFIILLLNYLYYIKKQSRKIKEINEYLYNVLNGDYRLRIREYEEGNLSSLQDDIYKITVILKEHSEKSLKDKKELESILSDISHQIKTPLTSMYMINELLENDELSLEVKKELLKKNALQLNRIEWLVSSLLKISRLDSGTITFKKENVIVSELIEKALEPMIIPMELKKQNIIIHNEEESSIRVDKNWTIEALINIIKNATEHTKEEGTITIDVDNNPIYTEIKIIDNGYGIDAYDLPHIFKRFYKGKASNKNSIGIGLNMSKKIIEKQNGIIMVDSKKDYGTTFTIRFFKGSK